MNTISILKKTSFWTLLITSIIFTSCDNDDDIVPEAENDLEVITDVKLIFTNAKDPTDTVEVTAEDPDGIGVEELTVNGSIDLDANTTYNLTFTIENHLAEEEEEEDHTNHSTGEEEEEEDHTQHAHKVVPSSESDDDDDDHGHAHGFDIAEEIEEEGDEHQFFFSFTNNAFSDPTGNGNIDNAIDNASDEINYSDEDVNGNPLGLETSWTTGGSLKTGEFKVRLQHQPDVKTATSGANDGDTDFELTFELNIVSKEVIK
jgi:hypothetical protein